MNSNDNGRAEARSLANRRLRRITVGTTLLGVAATGTFGWLAAVTYDGATAAAAETAIVSDSTSASTDTATSTATPSTTTTPTTTPTVTTTTGSGNASSGGS